MGAMLFSESETGAVRISSEEYAMRAAGVIVSAATILAALTTGIGTASASPDHSLNGTYTALHNGQWAKTREVYMDEPVVRSTWTISSTCRTPMECFGQVTSDQGWTAPIRMGAGDQWRVDRILDNWEPCQDGTAFPGHQMIMFAPLDTAGAGRTTVGSPVLAGWDKTVGPSGACGVNESLTIVMPFKLVKIG